MPPSSVPAKRPLLPDHLIAQIVDLSTSSPTLLQALSSIRENQRTHERAWFKARSQISEKYAKKRQLNTMLISLGGVAGVSEAELVTQEAEELADFDNKLRTAMGKMYHSQVHEVRALGIPVTSDLQDMKSVYGVIEELLDSSLDLSAR